MSEFEKINILKEILGASSKSGGEYLFKCAFCSHHKKKLSINLDKNKYKCWICERAGSLHRLVKRLGTFSQQQKWKELTGIIEVSQFEKIILEQSIVEQEEQTNLSLPSEFISLCNNFSHLHTTPLSYLSSRGIHREDILRWKIGFCQTGQYADRILVPSFNLDGKINYFIARTYNKHWQKYMNPQQSKDIIFNELYVDWDSDIILTEGVFDAIKIDNAIPILGSSLRENTKLFQQIIKNDSAVYIGLDPDAETKEYKIIESLLKYGIEVYKIPIKPYKDLGEMSKEEFLIRKKNASLIKNTDYLLLDKIMSI